MGKRQFNVLLSIAIIAVILIVLSLVPSRSAAPPTAADGVLDLSQWDFTQAGVIPLKGEWEFYWNKLLTPSDFYEVPGASINRNLTIIPKLWNNSEIDNIRLTGRGFATYRLKISTPVDEVLGIKIPKIFTSYKMWINGELAGSYGAIDEGGMATGNYTNSVYFSSHEGILELIVQVANYRHRGGGIAEAFLLGTSEQINSNITRNVAFDLFLFGCLFISGFYNLAFFIFRTKDRSGLYLSIFSFLISFRTLFVGEIYFMHLFPRFNWELAHKLSTLSYYLAVPVFFLLMNAIFPGIISTKQKQFSNIFSLVFLLIVIFTPTTIFTYVNPAYQLYTVLIIILSLRTLISACKDRHEGSYLITMGAVILFILTLNDIIFLSIVMLDSATHFLKNYITKGNLSSWGLLIFVSTHSFVLAKKFSQSFSQVESIKEELQELNERLEERVKERTLALVASNEQLQEAYKAISISEKLRIDFIQNISHDLRTPLTIIQGYIDVVLEDIVDTDQQKTYLARVKDKVNSINQMVKDLFSISQLQSQGISINLSPVFLDYIMNSISEKCSIDMMNSKVSFYSDYSHSIKKIITMADKYFVMADIGQLDRVILNLLGNALKYTPDGGTIKLGFDITDDGEFLIIEFSDTGIGISEENLPFIFQRFYKSKKSHTNDDGIGLGLAIAEEIVLKHGGLIWVESVHGQGSSFYFTLPIYNN